MLNSFFFPPLQIKKHACCVQHDVHQQHYYYYYFYCQQHHVILIIVIIASSQNSISQYAGILQQHQQQQQQSGQQQSASDEQKLHDNLIQIKIRALLFDLVWQTTTIEYLLKHNVTNLQDWHWLQQLKFYMNERDQIVRVRMVYAEFEYSYEFLGNYNKLVYTSLAHNCYLTLTQVSNLLFSFHLLTYIVCKTKTRIR